MTLEEMNAKYGIPSPVKKENSLASLWSNQTITPKKTFSEKLGNTLGTVLGGDKIGEGVGTIIARNQTRNSDALTADYSKLSPEAIARLEAKGVPTTESAQRAETASDITGPSAKEIIGDVGQIGLNFVGGGAIKGANLAVKGAKTGAIIGAGYGASQGLKDDKDLKGIAKSTLTGAAVGGVLGGVTGAISNKIQNVKANKMVKENDFLTDLVSPKATTKIKQQALREGRVTEQGLLSASKIQPSKRDLDIAEAVRGTVSKKLSPTQNISKLDSKIKDINTGVKAFVNENKVPFNTNQLKSKLNIGKDELKLVFASDKQAEKTYNAVVDEFMKHVKSKDTAGLLDARQKFDKIPAIKKLLQSQGLGENVKKEIVMTARTKANEYIASLLPRGNKFRDTLLKESKMIEAISNIAEKNTGVLTTSKLNQLIKKYPLLKTAISAGGAGLGLGVASKVID